MDLDIYKSLIDLEPVSETTFKATWADNGKYIGDIIREIDGVYVFYPTTDYLGAFTESFAYALGAVLEDLNYDFRMNFIDSE